MSTEQKHGAEARSKQKHGAEARSKQKHGADVWSRRMEQKHGADAWSRSMEQAEAWSKKKHATSISMDQKEASRRRLSLRKEITRLAAGFHECPRCSGRVI
jgi:hypothetical protein